MPCGDILLLANWNNRSLSAVTRMVQGTSVISVHEAIIANWKFTQVPLLLCMLYTEVPSAGESKPNSTAELISEIKHSWTKIVSNKISDCCMLGRQTASQVSTDDLQQSFAQFCTVCASWCHVSGVIGCQFIRLTYWCNNCGKIVQLHVPLLPCSIIWHWWEHVPYLSASEVVSRRGALPSPFTWSKYSDALQLESKHWHGRK